MFLEFVFFQILSLCIFCIFGQGFSDVQIDVYKVSKEKKLKKLSTTVLFARSKIECVHYCDISDCCAASYNGAMHECYLTATNCYDIDGTQSLPGWQLLHKSL